LMVTGLLPFAWREVRHGQLQQLHWWAFMGAVLSTLIVDGLFWIAVRFA
jgi:drug/metabolite transporter (DMT)-like permease